MRDAAANPPQLQLLQLRALLRRALFLLLQHLPLLLPLG